MSDRLPFIYTLQYWLFTPELQWQSRGNGASHRGTGNARGSTITARSADAGSSSGGSKDDGSGAGAGLVVERSLRQLSGGERRRVALAVALGYGELCAAYHGVSCDLLVLDEALGQMDAEGLAAAARVVQDCMGPRGTVLLVCQAGEMMEGIFDCVDTVVKSGHSSTLELVD